MPSGGRRSSGIRLLDLDGGGSGRAEDGVLPVRLSDERVLLRAQFLERCTRRRQDGFLPVRLPHFGGLLRRQFRRRAACRAEDGLLPVRLPDERVLLRLEPLIGLSPKELRPPASNRPKRV